MNPSQATTVDELSSNQEKVDAKVIFHFADATNTTEGSIILQYPSGDTDIMIIAIRIIDTSKPVLVDYGNGKNSIGIWLNSIYLDDNIRAALIGFHAFPGTDFVSLFFKGGKQSCFRLMKQYNKLINAFRLFGGDWELKVELIVALESVACHLFGYKDTDINKAR